MHRYRDHVSQSNVFVFLFFRFFHQAQKMQTIMIYSDYKYIYIYMYIMTDQRWVPRLSEYIGIYANTPLPIPLSLSFWRSKRTWCVELSVHDVLSYLWWRSWQLHPWEYDRISGVAKQLKHKEQACIFECRLPQIFAWKKTKDNHCSKSLGRDVACQKHPKHQGSWGWGWTSGQNSEQTI